MAARWVGLTRPHKNKFAARVRRGFGHTLHEFLHAIGAVGFLMLAAAMNFAMYPNALAAVLTGEPRLVGFVSDEAQLRASTAAIAPIPVDENEVRLLAATAWGEARSEGEDGMRAVAHVIVNRVGQRFGSDLETVVRAPKQFSAWNIGDPNRPLVQNPERYARGGINQETWETAQKVAREVLSGQSVDPTEGALFYHTRAIRPWWSRYGRDRHVIGAHVFYRDVPDNTGVRRVRTTHIAANGASRAARGPRAGRVHGRIQYAPVGANDVAPPPVTVASPPATAIVASTPASSTDGASNAAF